MYEELAIFVLAIWFGLPAWIANATPVLGGGGPTIDGGRFYRDGRRIFGDGKTIRGLIVGMFFGTLTGLFQTLSVPFLYPVLEEYVVVTPAMEAVFYMTMPIAFLMSVGALTGDLIGSFIKRRMCVKSGDPSPMLDQLGFIILALIFVAPLIQPNPIFTSVLILTTLAIHWMSNALGYVMGLKKHPW